MDLARKDYQVIYLNGPSSAGKTTLAHALQEKLEKPFLTLGLDEIIEMMPKKLNDWTGKTQTPGFSAQIIIESGITMCKIHNGPFGIKMIESFYALARTLLHQGHSLIIDDVSCGKEEVDQWRAVLKQYHVLWVGLTAPVEVLEEREKLRKDRPFGLSRWQAMHVHSGVVYDLMLNTDVPHPQENVDKILRFMQQS